MSALESKPFDEPDDVVRLPLLAQHVVVLGEVHVARTAHQPGEVLVSASAASLLEGAGLALEDAGEHELRGLPGRRRVYRLVDGEHARAHE